MCECARERHVGGFRSFKVVSRASGVGVALDPAAKDAGVDLPALPAISCRASLRAPKELSLTKLRKSASRAFRIRSATLHWLSSMTAAVASRKAASF